ncbi:MAG: DUF523 domain-containing protein, partial [Planctomycetia bacterium]|nr:DUF523 domain-containing protein [Planctomycetia bacterium]
MKPVLVSACLTGSACRYDGGSCLRGELLASLCGSRWIAVCPEQLAGQPTPREKSCLTSGDGRAVLDGRASVRGGSGEDL